MKWENLTSSLRVGTGVVETLGNNSVHVWWVRLDDTAFWHSLSPEQILSEDEKLREQNFVFQSDKRRFARTRAFLRTLLSRYVDICPHKWRFRIEPLGRPEIDTPVLIPRLRFNVSHTRHLAAVVLSWDFDVGIDVECVNIPNALDIARAVLSTREYLYISRLNPASRTQCFFKYWTLKEAYAKALGQGLNLPFRNLEFQLPSTDCGRIFVLDDLEEHTDLWCFRTLQLPVNHQMAIAARTLDCTAEFFVRQAC